MSDLNFRHNRAVWFDIPVSDLDRASAFYEAVLGLRVHREHGKDFAFGVLEHAGGNGGCLIPDAAAAGAGGGILLYLNADGRIRAAVREVEDRGGRILHPIQSIGAHGFRAIVLDSEGNRIALHSNTDA